MCVFFKGYGDHRDLLSFPTRRSSDLSRPPTRLNSCESHAGRASRRLTARGASMVAAARWDAPAYARPLPPRSLDVGSAGRAATVAINRGRIAPDHLAVRAIGRASCRERVSISVVAESL